MKKAVKKITIIPLFNEISSLINDSKRRVAVGINSELVYLYWNVGKLIKQDILKNERGDYGDAVIQKLSERLMLQYGRGFSRQNIKE